MPSSIKSLKNFFKHTWHPHQMDKNNPSNFETVKTVGIGFNNDTELGEMKIITTRASITTETTTATTTSNSIDDDGSAGNLVVPCGNGACNTFTNKREPHRHESPWHKLKTIFLVSVIAALIVWVLVYTLLSQYQIL